MFDFLKKKISGFIDKVTGKENIEKLKQQAAPEIITEEKRREVKEEPKEEKPVTESKFEHVTEIKKEPIPNPVIHVGKKEERKIEHSKEKKEDNEEFIKTEIKIDKKEILRESEEKPKEIKSNTEIQKPKEKLNATVETHKEKERKINIGVFDHLKSIITGEIEIGKKDINEMLENLELELIESDVTFEVAESIKQELIEKIVGKKIKRGELNNFIKNAIRETLLDVIVSDKIFDIVEIIKTYNKPTKIMFIGTNGSGKTTTIAKIGKMFMNANYKVVLAAADTFRAAAIEQLAIHAQRLDIKIIKRDYGGDPTAVAYDAVSYANAHAIDVVLIDTAGRQENNYNLLNEMKKMQRVIKPDLKIYIGESITGNAIISQVSEFNKEIGIDAVILTKLDCDAKGGTVISISKVTGIPIIYLGTGQNYSDIEKFDAKEIVNRILS